MIWKCEISKVNNGYVVSYEEEYEEGKYVTVTEVFEEIAENSDIYNIIPLLYYISEYFGVVHSKHSKENLVIKSTIEEQDE